MTENSAIGKKKHFRFLSLISGIFSLYFLFFSVIPSSFLSPIFSIPITDVSLELLNVDNVHYFVWGYTDSLGILTSFNQLTISDALPFIFWIITFLAGSILLMSSSYKSKPKNMKKLIGISLFFLIVVEVYHFTLFLVLFFTGTTVSVGNGIYYLTSLILIVYIAYLRVSDYYLP